MSLQQLTALAVLIEGCVMRGNKAGSGGAVYGTAPAQVAAAPAPAVSSLDSSSNSSSNSTDALDSSNSTVVFASAAAAAAAAKTPIIAIVNTTLTANQAVAGDGGSAAFVGPLDISLTNAAATDSTAARNGGVLQWGRAVLRGLPAAAGVCKPSQPLLSRCKGSRAVLVLSLAG